MTKQILFSLLIFILFSCKKEQKQDVIQKQNTEGIKIPPRQIIIDQNNLVGFACYNSGTKSKPVKRFSEILTKRNYSIITKKLYSKNISEKYLATVICEKLLQKNLISLTEEELNQIKKNKNSNEKINTCSGCTNDEKMTLRELFSLEKNYIAEQTEGWLNEMIK